MIPRINMVTVSLDATYDDVLAVFRDSMYTRLPVYEDDKDNIIGLINIKVNTCAYSTLSTHLIIANTRQKSYLIYACLLTIYIRFPYVLSTKKPRSA